MRPDELIEAVRRLYVEGEIEAVNVFYRLERVCSGGEIERLIREWDRD